MIKPKMDPEQLRSNVFNCERELWEIRGLADAIFCCRLTAWDEIGANKEDARDHAIGVLAVLIRERAETIETRILGKEEI